MNLNNINKISIKQKIITTSLISVFILFFVFYFAIINNLKTIKQLRIEIVAQKINLERKLNREKNLSKLSSKMKSIEPEIARLEKVFVDKSGQIEFITTLEGIAQQNQINQKINLSPAVETDKKTHKTSQLQITATGNLKNIINYIQFLESMTYYININSISIEKNNNSSHDEFKENNILVNISAITYWK